MSYFWNGYVLRDFIFDNFNTHTVPGFIGVFVALFSVSVLYEGLFYMKKYLMQQFLLIKSAQSSRHNSSSISSSGTFEAPQHSESEETTDGGCGAGDVDNSNPRNSLLAGADVNIPVVTTGGDVLSPPIFAGGAGQSTSNNRRLGGGRRRISPLFRFINEETVYLLISSILHGCYAFIGYTLMNAVMTFNIWVFVAVCGGIGVGYFFFRTDLLHDGYKLRQRQESTIGEPFRNTIETDEHDDDTEYQTKNEKSPKRSPRGGRGGGSNLHKKTDYQVPSPLRKSQNKSINSPESPETMNQQGSPAASGVAQVIVVGAQVHSNYQQSM